MSCSRLDNRATSPFIHLTASIICPHSLTDAQNNIDSSVVLKSRADREDGSDIFSWEAQRQSPLKLHILLTHPLWPNKGAAHPSSVSVPPSHTLVNFTANSPSVSWLVASAMMTPSIPFGSNWKERSRNTVQATSHRRSFNLERKFLSKNQICMTKTLQVILKTQRGDSFLQKC